MKSKEALRETCWYMALMSSPRMALVGIDSPQPRTRCTRVSAPLDEKHQFVTYLKGRRARARAAAAVAAAAARAARAAAERPPSRAAWSSSSQRTLSVSALSMLVCHSAVSSGSGVVKNLASLFLIAAMTQAQMRQRPFSTSPTAVGGLHTRRRSGRSSAAARHGPRRRGSHASARSLRRGSTHSQEW